jgi:surface protein
MKKNKIIIITSIIIILIAAIAYFFYNSNKNKNDIIEDKIEITTKVDDPNTFYSFITDDAEESTLVITSTKDDVPANTKMVTHNIKETLTTYDEELGIYKTKDSIWDDNQSNLLITKVIIKGKVSPIRTTSWFKDFKYLNDIEGLENIDSSNLVDTTGMFANCLSLQTLDLSSLDMSQVEYASSMFAGCENLKTIYVSDKWKLKKIKTSNYMFYNNYSLVGQEGTTYDENQINSLYAHIDEGNNSPGYLTRK